MKDPNTDSPHVLLKQTEAVHPDLANWGSFFFFIFLRYKQLYIVLLSPKTA